MNQQLCCCWPTSWVNQYRKYSTCQAHTTLLISGARGHQIDMSKLHSSRLKQFKNNDTEIIT